VQSAHFEAERARRPRSAAACQLLSSVSLRAVRPRARQIWPKINSLQIKVRVFTLVCASIIELSSCYDMY